MYALSYEVFRRHPTAREASACSIYLMMLGQRPGLHQIDSRPVLMGSPPSSHAGVTKDLVRCGQVLVVANPANTNALILKENAPSIPPENITCLTRLDHNRALGQVRICQYLLLDALRAQSQSLACADCFALRYREG